MTTATSSLSLARDNSGQNTYSVRPEAVVLRKNVILVPNAAQSFQLPPSQNGEPYNVAFVVTNGTAWFTFAPFYESLPTPDLPTTTLSTCNSESQVGVRTFDGQYQIGMISSYAACEVSIVVYNGNGGN